MPRIDFKQGDVVQLIKDTASHKKGDIGVIKYLDAIGDGFSVQYYGESGLYGSSPEWFRLIDLDVLMGKKRK